MTRPESENVVDPRYVATRGPVGVHDENFTDTDEPVSQSMQINTSGYVDGPRFPLANSKTQTNAEFVPGLPLKDEHKFCNIDNDIQIFSNPLSLPTEPSSRQKRQENL